MKAALSPRLIRAAAPGGDVRSFAPAAPSREVLVQDDRAPARPASLTGAARC